MSLSREEIIRMARDAGVVPSLVETTGTYFAHVEALANAAYEAGAAAEREQCAKVCEDAKSLIWNLSDDAIKSAGNNVCDNLADAIRARGK